MAFRYDSLEVLDPDEILKPGDRIVIRFVWMLAGYYSRAAQWAAMEKALEGRKDFTVVSYRNDEMFLDVEIEVLSETIDKKIWGWGFLQPASIAVTGTILMCGGLISAVLISYCVFLTVDRIWRIKKTPLGPTSPEMKTLVSGIGAVGYAVLIGVVYVVLKGTRIIR